MSENGFDQYNPSAVGVLGSIFGLPFDEHSAQVVLLPIPWDVTVSYQSGAASGPAAILESSVQLDLEIPLQEAPWKKGIWMAPIDAAVQAKSESLRQLVQPYLAALENGQSFLNTNQVLDEVNEACLALSDQLEARSNQYIAENKFVGLIGGDHGTPLGLLKSLAAKHQDFGILQIDAHMDLRAAYEGFSHSHASIMHNACAIPQVSKIVQVGIRDYCEEEVDFAAANSHIVSTFYDELMKADQYCGKLWSTICDEIISKLPAKVYVSFDIDGLSPEYCSGTGTPVPGGLSFDQAIFLLEKLRISDKEVIGFDLSEVAPKSDDHGWNGNVGARVLYRLCNLAP